MKSRRRIYCSVAQRGEMWDADIDLVKTTHSQLIQQFVERD